MKKSDFRQIHNFTAVEVMKTGAKLKDVKAQLFFALDVLRELTGLPIALICVTTGEHTKGSKHDSGEAVDVTINGKIELPTLLKCAFMAGFTGIGVYWNGVCASYHFDIGRKEIAMWIGTKHCSEQMWTYGKLINDIRR